MINTQDQENRTAEKLITLTADYQHIIQTTSPQDLARVLAERQIAQEREFEHTQNEIKKLKEQVITDSLVTSVLSHGHFLEVLEREAQETEHMPEPSSVLMTLDLDHLRETNKMLGHPVTDKLLIAVGETIATAIHPGDSPGRTGGDEFSIILRHTNVENAVIAAQRIREQVTARIHTEFPKEGFSQTVSIGLCLIPRGMKTEGIRDIADAALYTIKFNGRNRIAIGEINPQTGHIETSIVPVSPTPTGLH